MGLVLITLDDFLIRRNPDDVAFLAHAQPLGLQDDVQRLIPGHILQAQGDIAGNGIAGNDVVVGEISNHLQHGAYFDILEIQGQLLAMCPHRAARHQLVGIFHNRTNFHNKLVITLIGVVLPQAMRGDGHQHVATLCFGIHSRHRRRKVAHIQALAEVTRQFGILESHQQVSALLLQVDANIGIEQINHDARFAITSPAEIDVA